MIASNVPTSVQSISENFRRFAFFDEQVQICITCHLDNCKFTGYYEIKAKLPVSYIQPDVKNSVLLSNIPTNISHKNIFDLCTQYVHVKHIGFIIICEDHLDIDDIFNIEKETIFRIDYLKHKCRNLHIEDNNAMYRISSNSSKITPKLLLNRLSSVGIIHVNYLVEIDISDNTTDEIIRSIQRLNCNTIEGYIIEAKLL